MALYQLDTENADRDIKTASITVLTHTPTINSMCIGLIKFGDGAKNLDGTGGAFQLVITVGGQTVEPSPQTVTFSTAVRAAVWTTPFPVPANNEVIIKVLSPNAADADVDVTAYLYDITYALPAVLPDAAGGLPTTTTLSATPANFSLQIIDASGHVSTIPDIKKNTALANFGLPMFLTTGVAAGAGLAVTVNIRKDGGAWGAATNAADNTDARGWSMIDWAAADLNADIVEYEATAAGCLPTRGQFLTKV